MSDNISAFEKSVQYVCNSMQVSRETAISNIMKITDSADEDALCHHYGLPTGYLNP